MKNRLKTTPLTIAVIVGLVLATAGIGTVAMADNSKPGDVLYGIDIALENAQLALTFSDEGKVERNTEYAAERVSEIKDLLDEKGVTAPGIDVALAHLVAAKKAVADLAVQNAELEAIADELDDAFELQEQELENMFKAAKRPLKLQKKQLKLDLFQALRDGDTERAATIQSQIADIESQLNVLELEEEKADDALDVEEHRIEALLEAEEKAREEAEHRSEEAKEAAEEELEQMEEELDEKLEEERELQEKAEENAKEALEKAEELQKEIEEFEKGNGLNKELHEDDDEKEEEV